MIKEEIQRLASEMHQEVIDNRRRLHASPELSFLEYETSAFVKAQLDRLGVPWQPMAGTGIVGLIRGDKPSDKIIALRADMDALPITELTGASYASRNDGIMHACGHDAHTSSLLGTAAILKSVQAHFGGTVRLLFQPGEEVLPGGASLMIKEGALRNGPLLAVIGQHVSPNIPAGKVGIRSGKFMASMDEIRMTVKGKGGHGAQPDQNVDPVIITAHILVALQQIVSRMAKPTLPTVLSFGKIIAEGAINIIPNEVYVEGTFRTLEESWRLVAHERMKKMASAIAEGMGATCDFNILKGYPFLINEEKLTANIRSLAEEYLGSDNVTEPDIWMASEDFSMYSQAAPSCFYVLGVRNEEKGIVSALHTPGFDLDESALSVAPGLMAFIAVKQLGN